MKLVSMLKSWWPIQQADAHCDIPCGIYDPIAAKIAAQTVLKMVMRIQATEQPGASASAGERATHVNTIGRYIAVKEEHAQQVKKELDISRRQSSLAQALARAKERLTSILLAAISR